MSLNVVLGLYMLLYAPKPSVTSLEISLIMLQETADTT